MKETFNLSTPLDADKIQRLHSGDRVLLSGKVYAGRDVAHFRLSQLLSRNEPLPFDIAGQVIYYLGPSPAKPGNPIGSAGPTSSYRMDPYTPELLSKGLKGMIGKGARNQIVKDAIRKYKAVYFAAIGGAGALISKCIISSEIVAYPELGTEALRRIELKNLPVFVVNDIYGGDLYEEGLKTYAR